MIGWEILWRHSPEVRSRTLLLSAMMCPALSFFLVGCLPFPPPASLSLFFLLDQEKRKKTSAVRVRSTIQVALLFLFVHSPTAHSFLLFLLHSSFPSPNRPHRFLFLFPLLAQSPRFRPFKSFNWDSSIHSSCPNPRHRPTRRRAKPKPSLFTWVFGLPSPARSNHRCKTAWPEPQKSSPKARCRIISTDLSRILIRLPGFLRSTLLVNKHRLSSTQTTHNALDSRALRVYRHRSQRVSSTTRLFARRPLVISSARNALDKTARSDPSQLPGRAAHTIRGNSPAAHRWQSHWTTFHHDHRRSDRNSKFSHHLHPTDSASNTCTSTLRACRNKHCSLSFGKTAHRYA